MKNQVQSGRRAELPARPKNSSPAPVVTRDRILDTAELLFAKRGMERTSIRHITAVAEANLGAINYHFGTKQKLIEAVFLRRLEPVNQRRLALLDQAEHQAGNGSPALEVLLEAMIRPTVEGSFAAGGKNISFMRLMARCHSEPNPAVEQLMRQQFQPVMERFAAAFGRALPELPREELFWRMSFMAGAMLHALLISSKEDSLPGVPRKKLDADGLVNRLVGFAAAGMKTSLPEGGRSL